MWVVKRATSLFNWFCSNDGRKFAFFLLPVLPDLRDRKLWIKNKNTQKNEKVWCHGHFYHYNQQIASGAWYFFVFCCVCVRVQIRDSKVY